MIAHALDDRMSPTVAYAEPLGSTTAEKRLAASGTVEADVADEDVFLWRKSGNLRRINRQLAARKTLPDIIVGVALQLDAHPFGQKCAQALTGRTGELDADRVFRQQLLAVRLGQFVAQDGPDGAVGVDNRQLNLDGFTGVDGALGQAE